MKTSWFFGLFFVGLLSGQAEAQQATAYRTRTVRHYYFYSSGYGNYYDYINYRRALYQAPVYTRVWHYAPATHVSSASYSYSPPSNASTGTVYAAVEEQPEKEASGNCVRVADGGVRKIIISKERIKEELEKMAAEEEKKQSEVKNTEERDNNDTKDK